MSQHKLVKKRNWETIPQFLPEAECNTCSPQDQSKQLNKVVKTDPQASFFCNLWQIDDRGWPSLLIFLSQDDDGPQVLGS